MHADDDDTTARLEQAVRAAETALIEFEIAVETYRIELDNFARLHEQRLGPLYARLEEIEARIAEAVAARTGDPADLRRAEQARALVTPMPLASELFDGLGGATPGARAIFTGRQPGPGPGPGPEPEPEPEPSSPPRVRPGKEARRLYRELVRQAHPDLVTDQDERAARDTFISRVNDAYAQGDTEALRDLAAQWERRGAAAAEPWRSRGEELAARLEWLAQRKEMLAKAAADLQAGPLASMLRLAPDDPDGLLADIAADLERTLAAREAELAALLARPDTA